MYFGGCYIQDHMESIGQIHRRGVERALLRQTIGRALLQRPSASVQQALDALPSDRVEELTASLVEHFHAEASFGEDKQGYQVALLKTGEVRRAFLKLAEAHATAFAAREPPTSPPSA